MLREGISRSAGGSWCEYVVDFLDGVIIQNTSTYYKSSCILRDQDCGLRYHNACYKKEKLFNQNKGQKEMVSSFFNKLLIDGQAPIPFIEIVAVTKACFKIIESIKHGGAQIEI